MSALVFLAKLYLAGQVVLFACLGMRAVELYLLRRGEVTGAI